MVLRHCDGAKQPCVPLGSPYGDPRHSSTSSHRDVVAFIVYPVRQTHNEPPGLFTRSAHGGETLATAEADGALVNVLG